MDYQRYYFNICILNAGIIILYEILLVNINIAYFVICTINLHFFLNFLLVSLIYNIVYILFYKIAI